MIDIDDLKVQYLGRSELDYPCFLLDSGRIAMYLYPSESFVFYDEGSLDDAGSVVYTSAPSVEKEHGGTAFCEQCGSNRFRSDTDDPVEIKLLQEFVDSEICPRSLREYLHKAFYSDKKSVDISVGLEDAIFCKKCSNELNQSFEDIIEGQSAKITQYTI